jgi:molecular chaperone DnaK
VYEVLGTAGDTFLGGDDLDERLVDKMVAKFLGEHHIDLRADEVAMMRLRAVAEQTKIELSRRSRAVVRVDEIAHGPRGAPLHFQIEISRDEFVREVSDIIERTFPVCREALQLAGVAADRIGDVLLVGGTTKIPFVRDQVGRFFQKPPRADVGAEDAVAIGAALQAASLEPTLTKPATSYSVTRGGTKDTFEGRAPSSPGLEEPAVPPASLPIARVSRPPTAEPAHAAAPVKTLFGVPQGPIARPDSAIPPPIPRAATAGTAKGFVAPASVIVDGEQVPAFAARTVVDAPAAAVIPAARPAPARPPVVLEVTPRGLGIGTVAGYCEELIRRNSRVPAAMKKLFTTSRDRQDVVRIVVCQGESRRLDHNVVIGDLVLQGLPPRPRGETSIEVTFELDASGILQVQARDALTGAEQRAELDLRGGMQHQDVAASRDRLQLLRR